MKPLHRQEFDLNGNAAEQSVTNKDARRSRGFRTIILSLLGILLTWEVVSRTIVAYLANSAPEIALALRSSYPTALLSVADSKLNPKRARANAESVTPPMLDVGQNPKRAESVTPPSLDAEESVQLRHVAEEVLLHEPLSARALRMLALAEVDKDEQKTERLLQAAVRRSLQESAALYWLMQKSYDKADYGAATRYADILLRTRPQSMGQVVPTLAAMAQNKDANGVLKELLATNPPWRPQFFAHIPGASSDARISMDLLHSLKETANPPTPADLLGYLNFLISHQFHELAYYTWMQFLPLDQLGNAGLLFNGSFEVKPSGSPFDWIMAAGSGVTVEIAAAPDRDRKRALRIEFGHGRVNFPGVTQLIMASPGTYKLQGQLLGSVMGRRGLRWRVTCANAARTQIGESPMVIGASPKWKDFEFSFAVPETECPAQHVRLILDARSESEQFVSGLIWYNDLRIVRVE